MPAPRPVCQNTGRRDKFYVYVILCSNSSFYIGQTQDLNKRWRNHCEGTAAKWTRIHKPIKIVHHEEFDTREEATKREKELKTGFGRRWLKKICRGGAGRQNS